MQHSCRRKRLYRNVPAKAADRVQHRLPIVSHNGFVEMEVRGVQPGKPAFDVRSADPQSDFASAVRAKGAAHHLRPRSRPRRVKVVKSEGAGGHRRQVRSR